MFFSSPFSPSHNVLFASHSSARSRSAPHKLVNAANVRLFSGSRTVATASADETAHVGTSARGADVPTPISRFRPSPFF